MFSEAGEAVLWIRAVDGTIPCVANLSALGDWRADGTIEADEELLRDWLHFPGA